MSEAPSTTADPLLGAQLGDYQVLEVVGEGGMGVVYRGVQPVVKKRVAIKVLRPEAAADDTAVQKLLAEAEAVNAIGHRGIVDIFTHGVLPDGRPYIVMEYLEGQPLDLWLHQHQRHPPVDEVVSVLIDICSPLAAAHRAGVVHRDLKPSNVFLCTDAGGERFVKLLDFGLAKRGLGMDGNTAQTSQTQVSGTPDYMAPEQARALAVSAKTDLYALGVIAFELLTGQLPYAGETPMDIMVSHVRSPMPDIAALAPDLLPSLAALVTELMQKKPEERPASAEAVRDLLAGVLVELGAPPRRFSGQGVPGVRPSAPRLASPSSEVRAADGGAGALAGRRSLRWPLVVGGVVLLGLGVGVVRALRAPAKGPESAKAGGGAQVAVTPAVEPPAAGTVDAGLQGIAPTGTPTPTTAGPQDEEPSPSGSIAPQPKPTTAKEPPSAAALSARVQKLEARAKRRPNLDPTALQFLGRFRIEAAGADTPSRRAKLSRALDQWERTFLR